MTHDPVRIHHPPIDIQIGIYDINYERRDVDMPITVGTVLPALEFATSIDCKELVAVYPVEIRYSDDGDVEYVVSSDPSGSLLVYKDQDNGIHSAYMDNTVGTTCLLDLL